MSMTIRTRVAQHANRLRVVDLIGSATPSRPARRPSTATNITVWPSCAGARRFEHAPMRRPARSAERALPSATVDRPVPTTPLPVRDWKSSTSEPDLTPSLARAATMAAASGCSLPCSRLAARRSSSRPNSAGRDPRVEPRLAFGQRAGLVHDQRVHLLEGLERLGVANQHPRRRAAAGADHDRHRRRQAERARGRR